MPRGGPLTPPLLMSSPLSLAGSFDAVGTFPPNQRGLKVQGAAEASVRQGRGGQRLEWGLWGGEFSLIGGLWPFWFVSLHRRSSSRCGSAALLELECRELGGQGVFGYCGDEGAGY